MRTATQSLEFYEDPATFLAVAGDHLAAQPVVGTVVATVAVKEAEAPRPRISGRPFWFAVVRSAGEVVGVAMRTAPFRPYPLFVLPMPDEAARSLARALYERGEHPGGSNGALPAARVLAEEYVALAGGSFEVSIHTQLFELRQLVEPPSPPGRARPATLADADVALAWFRDFDRAASEQAGRPTRGGHAEQFTREDVEHRIAEGRVVLWEAPDGTVVHLTGFNAPSFGVSRVGPVYTPHEHRGRGYASATVAHVSRHLLDRGVRVCLYTDQANPTSNHIYEAIGFRPVVDQVNLEIT